MSSFLIVLVANLFWIYRLGWQGYKSLFKKKGSSYWYLFYWLYWVWGILWLIGDLLWTKL